MYKKAAKVPLIAILLLIFLGISSNAITPSTIDQAVMVSATVPEELSFTLSESGSGIALTSIYPGPGQGTGSASIFSTGMWVLAAKDGTIGGDGKMDSGTKSLGRKFEVSAGAGFKDLSGNSGSTTMKIGVPGTYTYTTGYRQQFSDGDYAGIYSIVISWICSAVF